MMKKYIISLAFALCGLLAFGQSVDIRPTDGGTTDYTSTDNMTSQFTPTLAEVPLRKWATCRDKRRGQDYQWTGTAWIACDLDNGALASTLKQVVGDTITTDWDVFTHNHAYMIDVSDANDTAYIGKPLHWDTTANLVGEVICFDVENNQFGDTLTVMLDSVWGYFDLVPLMYIKVGPKQRRQFCFKVANSIEGKSFASMDDWYGQSGRGGGSGGGGFNISNLGPYKGLFKYGTDTIGLYINGLTVYTPGLSALDKIPFYNQAMNENQIVEFGKMVDQIQDSTRVAEPTNQVVYGTGTGIDSDAKLTYVPASDYLQSGSNTEYVRLHKDSITMLSSTIATTTSGRHEFLRLTPTPQVSSAYAYAPFGLAVETTPNTSGSYADMVWSLGPNCAGNSGSSYDATKPSFGINWETSWVSGGVPIMEWHEHVKFPDSSAIRLKSYTIQYKNGFNTGATPNIDLYQTADAFSLKAGSIWNGSPQYWGVNRNRSNGYAQEFLALTSTNTVLTSGVQSGGEDLAFIDATSGGTAKRLNWRNWRSYSFSDNLGSAMSITGNIGGFRDITFGSSSTKNTFSFLNSDIASGYRTIFSGDYTGTTPTQRAQVAITTAASGNKLMLGTRSDISLAYAASTENIAILAPIVALGSGTGLAAPAAGAGVQIKIASANTTSVLSLENTTVTTPIKIFATNATPESALTGSPGDFAFSNAGKWYGKATGSATNTGWGEFLTTLNYTTTLNGAYFKQGGNSFGAAANLGSNDAFGLHFRTNGLQRVDLDSLDGKMKLTTASSATSIDILTLYHKKSIAGADDDQLIQKFNLKNTTSTEKTFVQFKAIATNATNAAEDGQLIVNVKKGGTDTDVFKAGAQGITAVGNVILDKTITPGGTTGAQTINKTTGSVNFAAAATSLVVTNNLVSASSIIICTVGTNDTTMKSVAVVPASGSFTMYADAAATAETRVNFIILN